MTNIIDFSGQEMQENVCLSTGHRAWFINKTCSNTQTVLPYHLFKIMIGIFFQTPAFFKTWAIFHSFASRWRRLLVSQQWQHHFIMELHSQCCQIHADRLQIWLQHPHEAQHQQHQPDHPRLGFWLPLCRYWSCMGPRGQRGREQFVHQPDNT